MVARISGEGVPVMAWIFSIWSISLVPGNNGNRLTTCATEGTGLVSYLSECLQRGKAAPKSMFEQAHIFARISCLRIIVEAICLLLQVMLLANPYISLCPSTIAIFTLAPMFIWSYICP